MSCCRISKQELASPVGTVMVELWVPPTVILRTSFGKAQAMACDVLLASALEGIAVVSFRIPDAKAGRGDPDLSGFWLWRIKIRGGVALRIRG
ncbi:hypothetical protein AVEN_45584-1 [Araneus ventricosus]|uniref:Uncharacterized protein n=1 Tax=Araneus ventricosus TaxID=182803 RepID=A0A4Y2S2W6_ARAVE|nr:hypothetical protein AVEN_45584-1 [Araneus ventricosus]